MKYSKSKLFLFVLLLLILPISIFGSNGNVGSFHYPKVTPDRTDETCTAGWRCYKPYYKGFVTASCNWINVQNCEGGCEDGKCKPEDNVETPTVDNVMTLAPSNSITLEKEESGKVMVSFLNSEGDRNCRLTSVNSAGENVADLIYRTQAVALPANQISVWSISVKAKEEGTGLYTLTMNCDGSQFRKDLVVKVTAPKNDDIDTPLKKLQFDYITGKISEEEYREKEKELVRSVGDICQLTAPLYCNSYKVEAGSVRLLIKNGLAEPITVNSIELVDESCTDNRFTTNTISANGETTFVVDCAGIDSGEKVETDIKIDYDETGGLQGITATGMLRTNVETTKQTQTNIIDLSNYLDFFIKDGKFNGVLVVGDKATVEAVVAISDIANYISKASKARIDIGATKLASEIQDIFATNIITVGNPCVNSIIPKLLDSSEEDCQKVIEQGKGIIKLLNKQGKLQLVIAAYEPKDITQAAYVLTDYKDYVGTQRGTEIEVTRIGNVDTLKGSVIEVPRVGDKLKVEIIESSKTPTELISTPKTTDFKNFLPYLIGIFVLIVVILGVVKLKKSEGFLKRKKRKVEEPKKEEKEEVKKEIKKLPFDPNIDKAVSVSNFTLKFGRNTILENVSLEVNKGEMVCLLGGSGTGKSTIIEALVGRKTPTKGVLKILGESVAKNKKIFDYVGFVPQHAELYMNQTVMQNLLNSATKWGIKDAKNKIEKVLSKIGLLNRKNLKASKLSGGQQKLLSLGMELIRDIEVCILDEPTTGLDPNTRNNIITILSHISTQLHKTILFTTHFMDDAEECDKVIILADKKIIAEGPPSKLEKMLPGGGKVVNIILDNVTDDLLKKIEKIDGVKKIVREGRNLRILTDEPNAIRLGRKIDEVGGVVNEAKIDRATMMEVFVYHTGSKEGVK